MAKDIFVEFKGTDIYGDVRDSVHGSNSPTKKNDKPTIEVTSWRQRVIQPKSATTSTAGGHSAERCEHEDMVFTKDIDAASPKLLQACSTGTIVKDVIVYFYRAVASAANTVGSPTGVARKQYLKIEMKNVLISSVAPSVGNDGFPSETFTLRYSAIRWTYDEVRVDGSIGGHTAISGNWNLATNTTKFE